MKKLAVLLSVLMLVAFTSGVSLAKSKAKAAKVHTETGEIVSVDAQTGTAVLKVKGKDQTLKAEPKMLEGLQAGEKVTIQKSGNMIKSIKPVTAPATMKETPKNQ